MRSWASPPDAVVGVGRSCAERVLADHHGEVCRRLAGPAERRFHGLATTVTGGRAVVLDDAVAAFDCTVHREVVAGDHTIVLLQLHAVRDFGSRPAAGPPGARATGAAP